MKHSNPITAHSAGDGTDALMVCAIRLLLAISGLLTLLIDPDTLGLLNGFAWMILSVYTLHSALLCVIARYDPVRSQRMLVYWLDVLWCMLIVFFTHSSSNILFLFFFFIILVTSFRWGFKEGASITLAAALLYTVTALSTSNEFEAARLLFRSAFLLGMGYMMAYWGGSAVAQRRHLAILRDVSQLSNPRFGVDQTIASVLEKTRNFFNADSCILLMRDTESATWSMRTATGNEARSSCDGAGIAADTIAPLLAFAPGQLMLYTRPRWPRLPWGARSYVLEHAKGSWSKCRDDRGENLADLLEARSVISVPLPVRNGSGRLFITRTTELGKTDALLLSHIGAQAFPVIENIELLDRLASQAALREREKLAHDLHDTALQPYIGLRHGLSALRNKAAPDNPLSDDLDQLISMTSEVIKDLRHFAASIRHGMVQDESELMLALQRQAAYFGQFHGIDIDIRVDDKLDGKLDISDRLAAEVFQIISEGMSNLCKHSTARRALVHLACANGMLAIRIDNDNSNDSGNDSGNGNDSDSTGLTPQRFVPRSITERTEALGGRASVMQMENGITSVQIEIPL